MMLKMRRNFYAVKREPQFIGIAGGSGAGKTWLAKILKRAIGKESAVISLDDFYKDRSRLPVAERALLNFDDPNAIDWRVLKKLLSRYQSGESVALPRYDFTTHTLARTQEILPPKQIIIIEGLWLFRPLWLRNLFTLRVYVNCPETLRRTRRIKRDLKQRGRTRQSVTTQFDSCVSPMHDRYVEPQKSVADVILDSPINLNQLNKLISDVKSRVRPSYAQR